MRVESMTKTDTRDSGATLAQLERLAAAGCELARVAVPDMAAARAFGALAAGAPVPVMADIHFDFRLAMAVIEGGARAVRLNPGNITRPEHLRIIAGAMAERGVVARVGANAGSLAEEVRARYGGATAEALAASALEAVARLEDAGVGAILASAKAVTPAVTLEANRLIAAQTRWPLHVGITEAGYGDAGVVRSAVGLALILAAGLGDTLRVSLTDEPEREVAVGYEVLRALDLRRRGPTVVSCPGCGRTEVDIRRLAAEVYAALVGDGRDLTVAVMGCAVNGPGEAREADVGIAGGRGRGVVYRRGKIVRAVAEDELVAALQKELDEAGEGRGC